MSRPLDQSSFFFEDALHDIEPPPFLIDGVLPMRSVNMLFGDFNLGKTFIAIDMAAAVSIGKHWQGHATEEGDVLYIASEGDPGNLGLRTQAWREYNTCDFPLPILFYADVVDLMSTASDLVTQAVDRGLRPRLIIIDTLGMALDESENDNKVMNDLIKKLRDNQTYEVDGEEFDISWLLVHHVGWGDNGRPRGGSSMPGGLDYVMGLKSATPDNTVVELFHYKAKNSAKFMDKTFKQLEVADSLVYEHVNHEDAKLLKQNARGTDTSDIGLTFLTWLDDWPDEVPFTQAVFRKARGLEANKKSTVSNIFKNHEDAGTIYKDGNQYRKQGIK